MNVSLKSYHSLIVLFLFVIISCITKNGERPDNNLVDSVKDQVNYPILDTMVYQNGNQEQFSEEFVNNDYFRYEGHYIKPPKSINSSFADQVKSAVVEIGGGTGVQISKNGYILTNYHNVRTCVIANSEKIIVHTDPILLNPPISCGSYEIVVLPPSPFQLSELWFMGMNSLHVNNFLDWISSVINPMHIILKLSRELSFADWAIVKKLDGKERSYITLNNDGLNVSEEIVTYGFGQALQRKKFGELKSLEFLENLYSSMKDESPVDVELFLQHFDQAREYILQKKNIDERPFIWEWDKSFPNGVWASGLIRKDGFLAYEWQSDLSYYYLKPLVEKTLLDLRDPLINLWFSATDARMGIVDLFKAQKGKIDRILDGNLDQESELELNWRIKNIRARKESDMTHSFYQEELISLEECRDNFNSLSCRIPLEDLMRKIDENIAIWENKSIDQNELKVLLEKTAVAETEAMKVIKSHQSNFNMHGFVHSVDAWSGFSGAPLVSVSKQKVIGIHRASPWGKGAYFIPSGYAVDARWVRNELNKLGLDFEK